MNQAPGSKKLRLEGMLNGYGVNSRPHPGPLPQEREEGQTVVCVHGPEGNGWVAADRNVRAPAYVSRWPLVGFTVFLLVGWLGQQSCEAADKSGVSLHSISLPSGPGSIEGLGESFQPTLNTGTAKYGVRLAVPPGTAGHSPALSLVYEGGQGNGPLGFGWALPVPYIQRQCDKGIPRYIDQNNGRDDDGDGEVDEADEIDVFINELKEELVPQADGYYFCENEGAFVRYRRQGESWEGRLPDGTLLQFGLTVSGRVGEATTGRVFKWLLERSTDTSGNTITHAYSSFPGDENRNQKYLTSISYGPGAPPWNNFHFVRLLYEGRSDWFEDGRSGFLVRTGQRLKEVVVGTQGPVLTGHAAGDFNGDGTTDFLVRSYRLNYLQYDPTNSHWSLLSRIVPVGADGSSTLPPATFGYVVCNPPPTISAAGHVIGGTNEPPWVMDNELVDLVDVNADGLPDILKTEFGGGMHSAFLNRGEVTTPTARTIRWEGAAQVASADGLAWNVNLESTDEIAHLADMDGDGLSDLVCKTAIGTVYYFANSGKTGWGERRDMSVLDFAPPSPFGEPNVKTADVDFDKRIDVIQSIAVGDSAEYRIWFNRGEQRYSYGRTTSPTRGFLLSQKGVHLCDFNGDRVPDLVWLRPTMLIATAGLGHGNFADPVEVSIPDRVLDDQQVEKAKLQDVTGDGLADLVIERAEPGVLWYWINLGNYTFSGRRIITDVPTGFGFHPVTRWADLNGNGTTDLVYADSSSNPRLSVVDIGEVIGCVPRPHILVSIENGIGRKTIIHYEPSTTFALADAAVGQTWPDPMPFPVHVVAAVTNSDSLGHSYATQYRYHDGYYDAKEKEFRGFGRVEVIEIGDPRAPTLITRSHFDTGKQFEAMKGKLLRLTAEQEDGRSFWDETTSWATPPRLLKTGIDGKKVYYAFPVARVKTITELGQGAARRLESEFTYDNYGNPTRQSDYGVVVNGDRQAFDDERVTVTDYALNVANWLVRAPQRRTVQDENGVVKAKVEYFYDDETYSGANAGVIALGNLTMTRVWKDPADPAAWINATRAKYDTFGNPTVMLDPLAQAPGGVVATNRGHLYETSYDQRFHAYPIRETVHIGSNSPALTAEANFDEGLGTLASATDFNGQRTVYGYDVFGRLVHILKPGDNAAFPVIEYGYALAQPLGATGLVNYVETRLLDRAPGSAGADKRAHYCIGRSFADGLGRSLLSKQEAAADPANGNPRVTVSGAVQFNARGGVASALNPFYSLAGGTNLDGLLEFESIEAPGWQGLFHNNGQLVALGLASAHKTATRYDATLRPLETTNVDSSLTRALYEPLVSRAYDENDTDPASPHVNTPRVFYTDGLGRQIRTDEIVRLNDDGTPTAEPRTWTTSYQYDLNDQLTRITDSLGNMKQMRYDALNRKVFMDDPDRGTTIYEYDDASNLARTVDDPGTTNEQITVYQYDGANRLLSEDYRDAARPEISRQRDPDVLYHYDVPSAFFPAALNLKGKVAWVEDLSGAAFHSFDRRGDPEWKIKRIDNLDGPRDFRTAFKYDVQDRLIGFTYPDGTVVTNVYNEANQLTAVPGFLDSMTYLPSGQVRAERLANGVATEHAYNGRLRRTYLRSIKSGNAAPLQDYAYRFDLAGNIMEITDAARPDSDPASGDQVFEYDCLDRLVRAQGPAYGVLHYRYNRLGNLLQQRADSGDARVDLGDYRYGRRIDVDGAGPHAVTNVTGGAYGSLAIAYDANGNYRRRGTMECFFDYRDRLVRSRAPALPGKESFTAEYRYDYQGRRVLKRIVSGGRTNETLYPGPEFEIRTDRHIKYIFAGGRRVAQVETREFRTPLTAGWNFLAVPVQPDDTRLDRVLSSVQGAWTAVLYNKASGTWIPIQSTDPGVSNVTVRVGDALWVYRPVAGEFRVVGSLPQTGALSLDSGCNLFSTYVNELLPLGGLPSNNTLTISRYDNISKTWATSVNSPSALSNTPASLQPATVYWLRTEQALAVQRNAPAVVSVTFFHPDHLGSANFITDSAGRVVESTEFYPFGVERHTALTNGLKAAYRFTGKEQDGETGLLYYGARHYDSAIGRFASPDPLYAAAETGSKLLAEPQKMGLYSYVLNNPVRFVDPTGFDETDDDDDIIYNIFFRSPVEESYRELEHQQAASYGRASDAFGRGEYGYALSEWAPAFLAEAPKILHNALLRPANLAFNLVTFGMGATTPPVELPPVTTAAAVEETGAAAAESVAPAARASSGLQYGPTQIPAGVVREGRVIVREGGEIIPRIDPRMAVRIGGRPTLTPSQAAAEAARPAAPAARAVARSVGEGTVSPEREALEDAVGRIITERGNAVNPAELDAIYQQAADELGFSGPVW